MSTAYGLAYHDVSAASMIPHRTDECCDTAQAPQKRLWPSVERQGTEQRCRRPCERSRRSSAPGVRRSQSRDEDRETLRGLEARLRSRMHGGESEEGCACPGSGCGPRRHVALQERYQRLNGTQAHGLGNRSVATL